MTVIDSAGREFRPPGTATWCEVLGVLASLVGALAVVGTVGACFALPAADAPTSAIVTTALGAGFSLLALGALLVAAGVALVEQVRLRQDVLRALAERVGELSAVVPPSALGGPDVSRTPPHAP